MNDQDDHIDDGWDLEEGEDSEDEADADSEDNKLISSQAPRAEEDTRPSGAPAAGQRSRGDRGRRRPPHQRRPNSEEFLPQDERARLALKFVQDVVYKMGMDCRVRLRRPKEGNAEDEINIEIAGKDAGRIIGKKGQVLQALQFLAHRVINRPGSEKRHIMVDAEGYRSRRDNSLATMARRLGRQAVEEGKIITFEPMNPRDRRVVHLALAKFEGVITRSDGEGDERRVQIIPVRRSGGLSNGSGSSPSGPSTPIP